MNVATKEELREEIVTLRNKLKAADFELSKVSGFLLETTNKLNECAGELHCMIDMKNAELESDICSTDLQPPDYFDAQTVHESMVQCKINRELLGVQ